MEIPPDRHGISAINGMTIPEQTARHSHASMLIEMGIPIMEISERLGHENTQVTLRIYAHLYPGKARNVSSRIEDLFSQDSDGVDPNF